MEGKTWVRNWGNSAKLGGKLRPNMIPDLEGQKKLMSFTACMVQPQVNLWSIHNKVGLTWKVIRKMTVYICKTNAVIHRTLPAGFTQARGRSRHWSTASSMTRAAYQTLKQSDAASECEVFCWIAVGTTRIAYEDYAVFDSLCGTMTPSAALGWM